MISMLLADKLYNSITVCVLCGSMNFHSDKQLFQVAGTGDRTTDPWITKPALYLYTMGDPLILILNTLGLHKIHVVHLHNHKLKIE